MSNTTNNGLTSYNPTAANGKPRKFFNDSGVDDLKIQFDTQPVPSDGYGKLVSETKRKLKEGR
jgi:hypothetical protein